MLNVIIMENTNDKKTNEKGEVMKGKYLIST